MDFVLSIPGFRAASPGDIVIMLTLPSQKEPAVPSADRGGRREAILLPPYPDFDPIENAFASFKAQFRAAAVRTFEAMIGSLINRFTLKDTAPRQDTMQPDR